MWYYFLSFYDDCLPQVYGPFMERKTRDSEVEVLQREDDSVTVILVEVDPTDAELSVKYPE